MTTPYTAAELAALRVRFDWPCTISRLVAELTRAREALRATTGYLLNAKIDLETGAPKRTAIATIEGGLKIARAALGEESADGTER